MGDQVGIGEVRLNVSIEMVHEIKVGQRIEAWFQPGVPGQVGHGNGGTLFGEEPCDPAPSTEAAQSHYRDAFVAQLHCLIELTGWKSASAADQRLDGRLHVDRRLLDAFLPIAWELLRVAGLLIGEYHAT